MVTYADRVKAAKHRLEVLGRGLGSLTVSCASRDALVSLDGRPAGKTPLAHRIYGKPGAVRLTVEKAGHEPFARELTLLAGKHQLVVVELRVKVTAPPDGPTSMPAAPPSRPFYKRWWFWTAVGVVVAGSAAAIVASQTGGDSRVPVGELPELMLK